MQKSTGTLMGALKIILNTTAGKGCGTFYDLPAISGDQTLNNLRTSISANHQRHRVLVNYLASLFNIGHTLSHSQIVYLYCGSRIVVYARMYYLFQGSASSPSFLLVMEACINFTWESGMVHTTHTAVYIVVIVAIYNTYIVYSSNSNNI